MKKIEVNNVLRRSRRGEKVDYLIINIIPTNSGDVFIMRKIIQVPMPIGEVRALKRSSLCDYKVID